MFVIKKDIFPQLTRPISQKLFGENKTWRGFVFVPIVNAVLLYWINFTFDLQLPQAFYIGFLLGFTYMLFELPNSWMKRRLGIQAGQQATSHQLLFAMIDKMDSAFGVTLLYFVIGFISLPHALLLFVICSATHIMISQLLVQFNIKKSF
ncbi:CDP-archaeol synthase [uncultured Kordia sp.]|uniref:CDP-archaeol synthase n=1 Tax=uncultured Kordia sp. TaxID=507699 RepID=UPI00263838D8|nr:CDP-archaeol synthase [uncultured Kordia sp.]